MANVIKGQNGRDFSNPDGPAVNVWVVDDDPDFRELLSRTIQLDPALNCSHQFSSAPLLLAALQLIVPPDVILLDIHMPVMTGLEALPHIRQLAPATAILMVSSRFDGEWQQQALMAGAWRCYRKTELVNQLRAAIHAVRIKNPPTIAANLPPPPPTGLARLRQFLFGS